MNTSLTVLGAVAIIGGTLLISHRKYDAKLDQLVDLDEKHNRRVTDQLLRDLEDYGVYPPKPPEPEDENPQG